MKTIKTSLFFSSKTKVLKHYELRYNNFEKITDSDVQIWLKVLFSVGGRHITGLLLTVAVVSRLTQLAMQLVIQGLAGLAC